MKHIHTFENFLTEGISYKNTYDADLEEIGGCYANNAEPTNHSREALEHMASEALEKAKPFPLTGVVKTDAPKLIKHITDMFKRAGIDLSDKDALVYSPNFANEIEIPVMGSKDIFFQTYLDYSEMASNGSDFVITGCFASQEEGSLDTMVNDLSNFGDITASADELKKYMENKK